MGEVDRVGVPLFWQQAEAAAAVHARSLGFDDAAVTVAGSDGGLDLAGTSMGGQVKAHRSPVGRPDVQRLVGAAWACEHRLFYSASGYTPAAAGFADECGVALFVIDAHLHVTAANDAARSLAAIASAPPAPAEPLGEGAAEGRRGWVAAVLALVVIGTIAAAGPVAVAVGLEARRRRRADAGWLGLWLVCVGLGILGCAVWSEGVANAVVGEESGAVVVVAAPVAAALAAAGAVSAQRGLWSKLPLPAQLTD